MNEVFYKISFASLSSFYNVKISLEVTMAKVYSGVSKNQSAVRNYQTNIPNCQLIQAFAHLLLPVLSNFLAVGSEFNHLAETEFADALFDLVQIADDNPDNFIGTDEFFGGSGELRFG